MERQDRPETSVIGASQSGPQSRRCTEELVKRLFESHRVDPERVHLSILADEVWLDVNTAIPCGLLCYELISNCLKHAFPGQQSGDVTITIRAVSAGQLTVTIHDTGIGFPARMNFRKTESLGLQVACLLIKQLQGTITLTRDCGTCFALTFPSRPRPRCI